MRWTRAPDSRAHLYRRSTFDSRLAKNARNKTSAAEMATDPILARSTRVPFPTNTAIDQAIVDLQAWTESRNYAGYDPFDLLNSPFLGARALHEWPLGIAFIQLGKRYAGLTIREWLRVRPSKNPKALGLFMASYCDLARCGERTQDNANYLKGELKRLRSPGEVEYCWGYDWDHVSRGGSMPAFSPNCIATYFCANALLDMAELFGDREAFEIAASAGRWVATRLLRLVDTREHLCLSYTPTGTSRVYNASALSAALLARLACVAWIDEYRDLSRRAMKYLADGQERDGAWKYGPHPIHHWIDGFHTGYNLEALMSYRRSTGDDSFDEVIRRGYHYYVSNFFAPNGAPKYFQNSLFPIDVHSCSQAILTFCDFDAEDGSAMSHAIHSAIWAIKNMRAGDGSFYFQKHRHWTNRTPYMRWGQAWMLHALSRLKRHLVKGE